MKKMLANKKTAIVCLILSALLLAVNIYMIARPVSYGMGYHAEEAYEGGVFEGTMKFYSDGSMVNCNTNFDEELKSRYYYKDGYIFYTMAETDEEYNEEVAYINENFDEAIHAPFYADKINAFKLVAEEVDGYSMVYTCTTAIVYVAVGCALNLVFVGLMCICLLLCKKRSYDYKEKECHHD